MNYLLQRTYINILLGLAVIKMTISNIIRYVYCKIFFFEYIKCKHNNVVVNKIYQYYLFTIIEYLKSVCGFYSNNSSKTITGLIEVQINNYDSIIGNMVFQSIDLKLLKPTINAIIQYIDNNKLHANMNTNIIDDIIFIHSCGKTHKVKDIFDKYLNTQILDSINEHTLKCAFPLKLNKITDILEMNPELTKYIWNTEKCRFEITILNEDDGTISKKIVKLSDCENESLNYIY